MIIKLLKMAGVAGVLLHSVAQPVYAADQQRPLREDRQQHEHIHPGPPEEALLACKGLSENDACAFAGRNDEMINGVCALPPRFSDSTALACKPDQMPDHPDMEPPADRED